MGINITGRQNDKNQSISNFFFCGTDPLIITNVMYIYLMDEHISKNYTVVRKCSESSHHMWQMFG